MLVLKIMVLLMAAVQLVAMLLMMLLMMVLMMLLMLLMMGMCRDGKLVTFSVLLVGLSTLFRSSWRSCPGLLVWFVVCGLWCNVARSGLVCSLWCDVE